MKLTRRTACASLAAAAAGSLLAKTSRFQIAICNETYDPMSFADGCRAMKKAGYDGIEVRYHALRRSRRAACRGAAPNFG